MSTFSSPAEDAINKSVTAHKSNTFINASENEAEFSEYYEIEDTAKIIIGKGYKRVCPSPSSSR